MTHHQFTSNCLTGSTFASVRWISDAKQYGMIADVDIPAETVLHVGPVVFLNNEHIDTIESTPLNGYSFTWVDDIAAFPLGLSGMFNHSHQPNCDYEMWAHGETDGDYDFMFDAIRIITNQNVKAGQELCIDYTQGDPNFELWFEAEEKTLQ